MRAVVEDRLSRLRALPAAHALLAHEALRTLAQTRGDDTVKRLVRASLERARRALLDGSLDGDRAALTAALVADVLTVSAREQEPGLRAVVNATGVVLHTNLGRAPLGDRVLDEVREACRSYATLEYDLDEGRRGHRDLALATRLARLTGADDATVVNNGAAAVLLASTALAAGREVVVSRGELVEIGGGFRIPDVLTSCGATLVEVGTTNRTRVDDYARAITGRTGAVMKVHPSNFAITGFTASADVRALADVCRSRGVPLVEDLGSGAMVDTAHFGVPRERTARDALAEGVDLVIVSGDKLLGGPQAGILAGRAELVARMRRHPLMRALRPGRLVVAALDATLRAYEEQRAHRDVAAVALLAQPLAVLEARARRMAAGLPEARVAPVEGRVGGGTLPTAALPSWGVRVVGIHAAAVERRLRAARPAVVARIESGEVVLDARTVRDDEVDAVRAALTLAVAAGGDVVSTDARADDGDDGSP